MDGSPQSFGKLFLEFYEDISESSRKTFLRVFEDIPQSKCISEFIKTFLGSFPQSIWMSKKYFWVGASQSYWKYVSCSCEKEIPRIMQKCA